MPATRFLRSTGYSTASVRWSTTKAKRSETTHPSSPALLSALLLGLALPAVHGEERIDVAELEELGVSWTNLLDVHYGVYGAWAVGDVDADGFDDFLLETLEEDDATGRWVAYLIHGRPRMTGEVVLGPGLPGTWQIRAGDVPESSLAPHVVDAAPAGDVNGDGYGDLLLGYGIYPDLRSGRALLVEGGPDLEGTTLFDDLLEHPRTTVFYSSQPEYQAVGGRCRVAGDFDGDGAQDFLIAAPNSLRSELDENEQMGAVFLVFGGPGLPRQVDVASVGGELRGVRLEGFEEFREGLGRVVGVQLGEEVTTLGDFDGDGRADVVVVATERWPPSIYIILGQENPPPVMYLEDAASYSNVIEIRGPTNGTNSWFGRDQQVAGLGDVNGDGLADLAVSRAVQWYSIRSPSESFVQVFLGSTRFPRFVDFDALDESLGVTIGAREESANFGRTIASAGDFDGDGRPDLLIGAPNADPERRREAGETIVLLSRAGFADPAVLRGSFPGTRIIGRAEWESLGQQLSPAGDFDGDGFDDILTISRRTIASVAREVSPGVCRAYLIYGGPVASAPLQLSDIRPPFGAVRGGTPVQLSGAGFSPDVRVTFDGVEAASVKVRSSTLLDVVAPPGSRGLADVSVSVGAETRALPGSFFYSSVLPVELAALGPRGFTVLAREDMDFFAAAAGDFDGDGADDLVLSAYRPFRIETERDWVAVLVRGSRKPADVAAFEASERVTTLRLPQAAAWLDVSALGDIDGDRVEDFFLWVKWGAGYLVRGRPDWPAEVNVAQLLAEGGATEVIVPPQEEPFFRVPAAALGDLNGDGIDDFALSIQTGGATHHVRDIVFVAGRREWDTRLELPAQASSQVAGGSEAEDLGWQLFSAGDVNGDGLGDLLANSQPGPRQTAYLIYGDPLLLAGGGEELGALVAVPARARSFLTISDEGNWGLLVSPAGDVNGDGYADVLLGLPQGAEIIRGRSYLVFGSPALENLEIVDGGEVPPGVSSILGDRAAQQNGRVAPCGDVDGDGFDDFSVSSMVGILPEPGYLYVIKGKESFPPQIELGKPGLESFRIEGVIPLSLLVEYPTGVGDFNGDGVDDFVFRETTHAATPEYPVAAGRLYVILGGAAMRSDEFIRGDTDADHFVSLTDPVVIFLRLFAGGRPFSCDDAADADDDGELTLADAIYVLSHLFRGGPVPPPPFPAPGSDPTEDALGCGSVPPG